MAAPSDKPIVLYTTTTPNGIVPTILLEELKVCCTSTTRRLTDIHPCRPRLGTAALNMSMHTSRHVYPADRLHARVYRIVKLSIRDADIGKVHNQVKSDWFLKICPNGRIPAITHEGFPVWETSAILLYLARQFDKDHTFSRDPVKDPQGYSEELAWMFFAVRSPRFGRVAFS